MTPAQGKTNRAALTWAALLVCALILSACNKVKLGLSLVPWYAERQAKEMMPNLKPEQSQQLKAEIKRYWDWNKRTMLPAYASALRLVADGLGNTTPGQNPLLASALWTGLYAQSAEPLLKPTAALLHSLDEVQIQDLERRFAERQAKQRRKYLENPSKTFDKRVERVVKTLEYFAGPLQEAQKDQLRLQAERFPIPYQAWIDDQGRRQAELVTVLREHRSEAFIQALLRDWWLRPRTGGEDREAWQWDEAGMQEQVRGIVGVLDTEQREKAQEKLKMLAKEIEGSINEH